MRPWAFIVGSLSLFLLSGTAPVAAQDWHGGVAVLGDSYSDEYQFYPIDRASGRNWVELLAARRGINFGPFTTSSRGEPRNQGFAYNWARSDATTVTMLAQGQHTGAAEQVARGEVNLVWIFIGGNDFIGAMKASDPLQALPEAATRATANVNTAVETILAASPEVRVVLVTVPDVSDLPEFDEPLRAGTMPRADAVAANQAVRRFNAELLSWHARDPRVTVVDLYWSTKLAASLSHDWAVVAGRRLERRGYGNDIGHVFLGDHRHVGTIAQSVMAQLFVTTVNSQLGGHIEPLGNEEIVHYAESVPAPLMNALAQHGLEVEGRGN